MKVHELIAELEKFDPEAEVKKTNWEGVYGEDSLPGGFINPVVFEEDGVVWL